MKNGLALLLSGFLTLYYSEVSAQFLQDIGGKPYIINANGNYDGSPLLFGSWMKATVKCSSGARYKNMLVNVDLTSNTVLFFRDENSYAFSETVDELLVANDKDTARLIQYKRGPLLKATLPNMLLEVLCDSPMLVKQTTRNVVEVTGYGTAAKSYRYVGSADYYYLAADNVKKIKLTKENAQLVFGNNWSKAEKFAKENNLNFKNEGDWRTIIAQLFSHSF